MISSLITIFAGLAFACLIISAITMNSSNNSVAKEVAPIGSTILSVLVAFLSFISGDILNGAIWTFASILWIITLYAQSHPKETRS